MIDIHSHILPNVPGADDGSSSMEMSLRLLDDASADGVDTILCTPHDAQGINDSVVQIIQQLSPEAAKRGISLLPGCEYNFAHVSFLREPIRNLADTHFLLLEFNSPYLCSATENFIFELQRQGHRLISAHPERVFTDEKTVSRLAELGFSFQITAASILGHNGKKVAAWSRQLMESGFCHYIASDAHNGRRTYHLSECRARVTKFFGSEYANTVFDVNPARLLENKSPLNPEAPHFSFFQKLAWNFSSVSNK